MDKIREIYHNRWVRLGVVAFIYILIFIIWSGIWWALFGLPIIYDIYISKHYYRLFWGKHLAKKSSNSTYKAVSGWIEAILFAVVVASLIRIYFVEMYVIPSPSMERTLLVGDYIGVSKVAYGPKMPNTPLSIPLVHNINPFSKGSKSYVEWIKRPYHRLAGFDTIKHNDVVVFNYPEGDTVLVASPQDNFYLLKEQYGLEDILRVSELMVHPVDKRDNYIKRAIGLPGDVLEVRNGDVYIDDVKSDFVIPGKQMRYDIRHSAKSLTPQSMARLGLSTDNLILRKPFITQMFLTKDEVENLEGKEGIIEVIAILESAESCSGSPLFPRDRERFMWSEDNYGPIWIPRSGESIELTIDNLPLYRRVISVYEGNDLRVDGDNIYINGVKSDSYTFKMNYFFMMGDNRPNSFDSRFFGFVPDDHIVGKASFIWFSKAPEGGIRFNRIFSGIK